MFYATKFDNSLICEEFRSGYPENLTVYYYKTELRFDSVTFKMKSGGDPAVFGEQSIVTECYFTDVSDHLRPLYATIDTDNYAPADFQPNSLENSYNHVSQKVTTFYNFAGSVAKTVIEDRLDSADSAEKKRRGIGQNKQLAYRRLRAEHRVARNATRKQSRADYKRLLAVGQNAGLHLYGLHACAFR